MYANVLTPAHRLTIIGEQIYRRVDYKLDPGVTRYALTCLTNPKIILIKAKFFSSDRLSAIESGVSRVAFSCHEL